MFKHYYYVVNIYIWKYITNGRKYDYVSSSQGVNLWRLFLIVHLTLSGTKIQNLGHNCTAFLLKLNQEDQILT